MRKIHIITQAYNAEATIRRAIESVLAQTVANFRYYVLDSASADKTSEIIKEYAKRDLRIIPLHNDFNRLTAYMDQIPFMIADSEENDVFAMLDADDMYLPDAFERLFEFMDKNNLDLAIGGVNIISALTGMKEGRISAENPLIYSKDNFAWHFPEYYNRVRTVWGKFISFRVLKRCDFSKAKSFIYGADTAFILEVIKNTDRFGIAPEIIYNYYQSYKSISHQFEEIRMKDGSNLYQVAYSFLSEHGEVSKHNRDFLLMVYFNMIKESIRLMNNSQCVISEKQTYLKKIFGDSLTKQVFELNQIPDIEKYDFVKMIIENLN